MKASFASLITAAVLVGTVALAACSDTLSAGADRTLVEAGGPSLATADRDGAAAVLAQPDANACNAYECPAPYATCPGTSGLCTTNLATDVQNCGACDNECPNSLNIRRQLHASFACAEGRCLMLCTPLAGDCNKLVDDGCETDLENDPQNCGLCGNACKAGEICWKGACGCPPGYLQCDDACAKIDEDDSNCGACGHACGAPEADAGAAAWPCGVGVEPPNTAYNCALATCGRHCAPGFGDCNKDACTDGCETSLLDDAENCGTCGHACLPGQACVQGKCICDDPKETRCGTECVDLLNDAANCGACGNACPGLTGDGFGAHGSPVCVLGRCDYQCPPGFADCDHRIANGCEVDLTTDPMHCGSCGSECDFAHGQPCAAGRCLTKPCGPGVVF